jgi:diguanylate cyclase (GGDEF)-like protein
MISVVAGRALEKISLIAENRELLERLHKKNEEMEEANKALEEMAIRDGLTGLFNHRYFQETLTVELLRSRRHGRAFSLILIDVDNFKQYNDTHGHPEGDRLLSILAQLMGKNLRRSDVVARYGGEEFVIILPETSRRQALGVAEGIRKNISEYAFHGMKEQPGGRVTVSLGVAAFPRDGTDGSTLIKRADQALYRAKKSGRNTVC